MGNHAKTQLIWSSDIYIYIYTFKLVFRSHPWDQEIVTSSKKINSYKIFYDRTRKRWPFNTGDCLIEVTSWAGLTCINFITDVDICNICLLLENIKFISRDLETGRIATLKWLVATEISFSIGVQCWKWIKKTNILQSRRDLF